MSDFKELVAEWYSLMGISGDPQQGDLEFIREDHVLEMTATYISKLESIQQKHDVHSSAFADRVRARGKDAGHLDFLDVMCQRFLTGAGMTLRNEIPKSIPRSERIKARTLEINWDDEPVMATWKEVDVSFPLRPVLSFCAEHSAGADEPVRRILVEQLISDFQDGVANVGRLALQSHDDSKSVFHWEPALVSVEKTIAPQAPAAVSTPDESAFEIILEDWSREFRHVAESNCLLHLDNVRMMFDFDDLEELKDHDPVRQRVHQVVMAFEEPSRRRQVLEAMSSSTYLGLLAARATKDVNLFYQRGRVLKSIKSFWKEELTGKDGELRYHQGRILNCIRLLGQEERARENELARELAFA